MKKFFFAVLLAVLFLLPGCNKDEVNAPSANLKGAVRVYLKTTGLAADIVSVKVTIDGEQKALLAKNDTLFELYGFDPVKTTHVQIEPIFADVTPPTDKFDFSYKYEASVGLSEGKGFIMSPVVGTGFQYSYGKGRNPNAFEGFVNELKTCITPVDATISNGEVK